MNPTEIAGVTREVLEHDCYKIKELNIVPDVIFDIGANVGIFSKHAHDTFPAAKIIAVEPDRDNCSEFLMKDFPKVTLINKAIGRGVVYRHENQWGGAQECYHSEMMGYPIGFLNNSESYKPTDIEAVSLDQIVNAHVKDGQRYMVKIDCEGAENFIFEHTKSFEALVFADYFAIELHYFSAGSNIRAFTEAVLGLFELTHDCKRVTNMFYATKKGTL